MYQLTPIQEFAAWVLPVLFAITLHEASHGYVASKFGDKTALMLGRVTLNPIKHIDPIGTLLVPTALFFLSGFVFGWAKPVPVTYQNLKNPKRDMAIVALAGPLANLLMAFFWAFILKLGLYFAPQIGMAAVALVYMGRAGILINLILMLLNLLPIPPLDGSRIVHSFLNKYMAEYYYSFEPYGFIVLVVLLLTGILSRILSPALLFCYHLILQIFGIL